MEKQKEQIQRGILKECFQYFSLAESKDYLWQLFSLTVSGGYNKQPLEKREKLLVVYEHLQQVLDALESILIESALSDQQLTDPYTINHRNSFSLS